MTEESDCFDQSFKDDMDAKYGAADYFTREFCYDK
jgi:hypothetical protein